MICYYTNDGQKNLILDGFLVYNESKTILHALESSGKDAIEHVISSYKTLPLHVAMMVKTNSLSGQVCLRFYHEFQCVLVMDKTEQEQEFSTEITLGGKVVGVVKGTYSLTPM